jgi:alkylmercury lyase
MEVKGMTNRFSTGNVDTDAIALGIVKVFPALDRFEQRLSLELYRLLSEGQPVAPAVLAERLQVSVAIVNRILDGWPGVFSDSERRIVGYWGLATAAAYTSPHQLTIEGRRLAAWCAWDTLFLPHLLGKPAEVESQSPGLTGVVKLIVTPTRVDHVEPEDTHVSFLMPDAAGVQKDIVTTFCHFVHFFLSRIAGEAWAAQHPGTFILSVEEAHAIARRKNQAQYGEVLG